ncbi:MAG: hypothetical protein H6622_01725 [Halobacteriovoraceae bacterium]|nr:hypothetical protein [Halobacteriovoraceae bacterium]
MYKDDVENLREIQSLIKNSILNQKKIDEENSNIDTVEKNVSKRSLEGELLKEELIITKDLIRNTEKALDDFQIKLSQLQRNQDFIKTQKQLSDYEKEEIFLEQKKSETEEILLTHYEKVEDIEQKLLDLDQFLQGANESIKKMQEVASPKIERFNREIQNNSNRINNLLNLCKVETKDIFLHVQNIIKNGQLLAELRGNSCGVCRIEVDRVTQSKIENFQSIENCPGCKRILISI